MNIRNKAIATIATLAVVATTMIATPNQAQAGGKHFAAGLIGGIIAGAVINSARPSYGRPVYTSCYTQWETRYDAYGSPYSVKVKYCN